MTSGKFLEALGSGIGTGSIFCLSFSLSNRVNSFLGGAIAYCLGEICKLLLEPFFLNFIYSEKAKKFWEISSLILSIASQKRGRDFAKLYGLLRIYELYGCMYFEWSTVHASSVWLRMGFFWIYINKLWNKGYFLKITFWVSLRYKVQTFLEGHKTMTKSSNCFCSYQVIANKMWRFRQILRSSQNICTLLFLM